MRDSPEANSEIERHILPFLSTNQTTFSISGPKYGGAPPSRSLWSCQSVSTPLFIAYCLLDKRKACYFFCGRGEHKVMKSPRCLVIGQPLLHKAVHNVASLACKLHIVVIVEIVHANCPGSNQLCGDAINLILIRLANDNMDLPVVESLALRSTTKDSWNDCTVYQKGKRHEEKGCRRLTRLNK